MAFRHSCRRDVYIKVWLTEPGYQRSKIYKVLQVLTFYVFGKTIKDRDIVRNTLLPWNMSDYDAVVITLQSYGLLRLYTVLYTWKAPTALFIAHSVRTKAETIVTAK